MNQVEVVSVFGQHDQTVMVAVVHVNATATGVSFTASRADMSLSIPVFRSEQVIEDNILVIISILHIIDFAWLSAFVVFVTLHYEQGKARDLKSLVT